MAFTEQRFHLLDFFSLNLDYSLREVVEAGFFAYKDGGLQRFLM
jgi:hypothetical protein